MSNSSDFQNASQFEIRLVLLLACSERREEKEEKKKQQARLLDGLLKTASPVSLCYILLFLSYIRLKTFFVLCFFQQEKQINNTPMNFARRCISCNKSGQDCRCRAYSKWRKAAGSQPQGWDAASPVVHSQSCQQTWF